VCRRGQLGTGLGGEAGYLKAKAAKPQHRTERPAKDTAATHIPWTSCIASM